MKLSKVVNSIVFSLLTFAVNLSGYASSPDLNKALNAAITDRSQVIRSYESHHGKPRGSYVDQSKAKQGVGSIRVVIGDEVVSGGDFPGSLRHKKSQN
jgi:methylmalonyl-CoA mutase cobalamin-binding subunit